MKKFIVMIMIFTVLVFVAAGCDNQDNIMESPVKNTETRTPGNTNMPGTTASPGNTEAPGITEAPDNIEPTNPGVEDFIESIIPSDPFSTDARNMNASDFTDEELRNIIVDRALARDYSVYDMRDDERASVNVKVPTVDVEQTLSSIRESNEMASTRFVFKGDRVKDTGLLEKVAEFKTPLLSKSKEAVTNMGIANGKLDRIVLRKDEEFSFVYFLGEITEEEGYKEATVFVEDEDSGEIVNDKGLGGGVCQVASTLHGACLEAKMKIIERHPHSKKVSYIEEGKDAAIAGTYKDLKFVNNLDFDICIVFKIEDRSEIVEIYKI